MKKIFLMITMMTSFFFALSIDSNAISIYGTPGYNYYDNLTLDTPIDELSGETLRIFEYGNALLNPDFINGITNWNVSGANYLINNGIVELTPTTQFGQITQSGLNIGISHYTYANVKATTNLALLAILTGSSPASHSGNNQWEFLSSIETPTGQNGTISILDIRTTNFDTIYIDYIGALDLDYWNITHLTKGQLDYFYNLYILLRNGLNPQLIYDIGYIHAYDNGYDTGYDTGYDEGLSIGYNNGYDDGYNNGYGFGQEDGYETGFIDGDAFGFDRGYLSGENDGYNDAVNEQLGAGSWLINFVSGVVGILGVQLMPGVPLGLFLFIPLFFGLISFIYRLGGRRS